MVEKFPIDQPLTILIGAGVNIQALGKKNNILTNWGTLINKTFDTKLKHEISNYILEFEKRLVKETSNQSEKNASTIEKSRLKRLCKEIDKEQLIQIKNCNYPTYLFDKKLVENVISLNFDLIPEILMNNGKVPMLQKGHNKLSRYKGSNMERYREIEGIRYWHPHGDIKSRDSLVLGMRQYIKHLNHLEVLRLHHKSTEYIAETSKASTWYEALVKYPVLILGASLSDNELDIWGALVNRERNFGKGKNRTNHRHMIYMMWSESENGTFNKPDWVKPLFPTHYSYDKQWEMLKILFENK